jgi:hypothetical protein
MMTKCQTTFWAASVVLAMATSGVGCELIASVDRDQIPGPDASTGTVGTAGTAGAAGSGAAGASGNAGAGGAGGSNTDAGRDGDASSDVSADGPSGDAPEGSVPGDAQPDQADTAPDRAADVVSEPDAASQPDTSDAAPVDSSAPEGGSVNDTSDAASADAPDTASNDEPTDDALAIDTGVDTGTVLADAADETGDATHEGDGS